jgi:MFS family permease
MACGLAQSYIQVLITRLAVGVGESGYGPATWSIITDSFPREKVAFGTSTLNIGAQVGTGLALFLGGWALAVVSHFPTVDLPFGGRILNWQWAFILVGFPGLLWAFVVLTIKEPKRRGLGGQKMKVVPIGELARWIGNDWRAYLGCLGGVCMKYLMSMGPTTWLPTMLHRNFDWELSKAGLMLGAITIVVAPVALVIGGKWSERWTRQGMADANMRIMLYGLLVSVPVTIVMPLLPEPWMVLTAYGVALFISTSGVGPGLATFQLITPNAMRAQVSSLSQFGTNVLAFALAPLIIALFTDYLFGSSDMLHYSMALSNAVLGPLAIICVWQGIGPYRRAYERAVREFS